MVGGRFFLGTHRTKAGTQNKGPILMVSTIIKHIMSSVAEAEIGATFICAKEGIPIRITFVEMNHLKPATPTET
jgi:hypothetical protein